MTRRRLAGLPTHALYGVLATLVATACNVVPIKPPKQPDKDFVTDAQAAIEGLRADYVFAKGAAALLNNKVDEFLYVEDGLRLGRVRWKSFRKELDGCWNAPIEAAEGFKARTLSAADAAKHVNANDALHQVKVVRDMGVNAVNRVKTCPQALSDKIKGFTRVKDEAVYWARGKLDILNEVRVLAKDELPSRVKTLSGTMVSAPKTIATQLTEAETYAATLQKLGDTVTLKSTNNQIAELKRLQTEAEALSTTVQSDSDYLQKAGTEAGSRVTTGIADFGKKKRR